MHSWRTSKCHCVMLDKTEVKVEQGPFYFQVWHIFSVTGLALHGSETQPPC